MPGDECWSFVGEINGFEWTTRTKKSVSDGVVMLPDKEVIDGDVGNLGLSSIWSQESQPVLGGNDIVWVGGGLSQFQNIEEVLKLLRGQRVDVLPHHRGFPLVTVWSGPAKFTLTTVMPCKVTSTSASLVEEFGGPPLSVVNISQSVRSSPGFAVDSNSHAASSP